MTTTTAEMSLGAIALSLGLALGMGLPAPVAAPSDMRTGQVRFATGTTGTTIRDSITGREFVVYQIGTEAGQRMEIRLTSDNGGNYFNVYAPGRGPGDEALANAEQVGPMVSGRSDGFWRHHRLGRGRVAC